ncbi:MAG: P1 family peptidase [Inquilinus sp.]|nr:P1 family peptidase [Inquilinus sp.]
MSAEDPRLTAPDGRPRARGIGVPFDGDPGPLNAVTDVAGLEVGYRTVIEGEGGLEEGRGAIRTGVTAVLPRGRDGADRPFWAGCFSLNGHGEMTGWQYVEELGLANHPILITNTHSCGLARDAALRWTAKRFGTSAYGSLGHPVVGETYDGFLNDINGFHVTNGHVFEAIEAARPGPVREGSVGGGTGMMCYGYKGGSGTASRVVEVAGRRVTVGVFVQANFGLVDQLTVAGVPVGKALPGGKVEPSGNSIIGLVATDAALLPHQLKRLARRAGLGIARSGATATNGSGDLFFAFTTANADAAAERERPATLEWLPDAQLSPLFAAVVQATDEAVLNALVVNADMDGRDGNRVLALPHAAVVAALKQHGRWTDPAAGGGR